MPLDLFTPPVREWFTREFGEPTLPQSKTWPAIQRGENTLTLAPTGSGKTLAAFLWGIDDLYREFSAPGVHAKGVRLLYISPLKALNNDIQRNLRKPLAGIRKRALDAELEWPELRVAVRSGDTPQRERSQMVTNPPQILITTPETLYIILTSPKARDILRTVRTVIVDEIHVLAGDKRGAHLAITLERLQRLAEHPIQRIGLSATIKPLTEVARFLGGSEYSDKGKLSSRPVSVIDAHYEKPIDLQVVSLTRDFHDLPGRSIYPTLVPEMVRLIREHQTTLCFVNNRAQAERMADRLNQQYLAEEAGEENPMLDDGTVKGLGFMSGAAHANGPFRAHHGSLSKEKRHEMESALKAGELPALVGTASLELGIDIGAIDLMMQLDSPKSVAQGLQRIGRSGHLVGQTSKGRFLPTNRESLMEAAAVAGGVLRGEVEPIHMVSNSLDILAQQIVAMVAVDDWREDEMLKFLRQAKPFSKLSKKALHNVLGMLAGKYRSETHRQLRARLIWDKANGRLSPLRRSRVDAVTNAGTISDRGLFRVYLNEGQQLIGELDEEFVHESRVGDVFVLGTQVWRATEILDDRLLVKPAPGALPRMPFWRGELPWRPSELGQRVGRFRRETAEQLDKLRSKLKLKRYREFKKRPDSKLLKNALSSLEDNYALDADSAWLVLDYAAQQLDELGTISSDRTIIFELFDDALGDPRFVVHTPFGGRVNGAWGTAIADLISEKAGVKVEWQSNDDAIMLRAPDLDSDFPFDSLACIKPDEARERILRELPNSPVFGARFRQNAARSLLLPGSRPGQRMPFWLQRLRSKDLLQIVSQWDDFPVLIETYRDCLRDLMDVPKLEEILRKIDGGEIKIHMVETKVPSSTAQGMLWAFRNIYIYEWDAPRGERHLQALAVDPELLQDVLGETELSDVIRPEAIDDVQGILLGAKARDADELFLLLQRYGDLNLREISERSEEDPIEWISELEADGRVARMKIRSANGSEERIVFGEYADEYRGSGLSGQKNAKSTRAAATGFQLRILKRFLVNSGPVTVGKILGRYAFPKRWILAALEELADSKELLKGNLTGGDEDEYIDRHNMRMVHRKSMSILRSEVEPVSLSVFQDFLLRQQHVHPATQLSGENGLNEILEKLQGCPAPVQLWEQEVLKSRLTDFERSALDSLIANGDWAWVANGEAGKARSIFVPRGAGAAILPEKDTDGISEKAQEVLTFLETEGALFFPEIASGVDAEATTVRAALTDLALHGLITTDSISALDNHLKPSSQKSGQSSALAEQLSEIEKERPPARGRKRRAAEYRASKAQARRGARSKSKPQKGRWAPVYRFGILGKPLEFEERMEALIQILLQRYGVLTRECLTNEAHMVWGQLTERLRLMEMRGQVRRGIFIEGLSGPQFALPDMVDRLRDLRKELTSRKKQPCIILNTCDPAYFSFDEESGLLSVNRLPTNWVAIHRGRSVLVAEKNGERIRRIADLPKRVLKEALSEMIGRLIQSRRTLSVRTWNGDAVLKTDGALLLAGLGFYRDYVRMTRQR